MFITCWTDIIPESQASTTYLNSISGADKVGNPLLSTEDVLQRLSRSLPPSEVCSKVAEVSRKCCRGI